MRIQNLIGTTIFFPYAGINAARGKDIKTGEFSVELETSRFDDPLLKQDWGKGKIAILLSEKDKEILGETVVAEIQSKGSRPVHKPVEAVETIPAGSEEDNSVVEEIEPPDVPPISDIVPPIVDDEVKVSIGEEALEEVKTEEVKTEEVKTEEVKEEEPKEEMVEEVKEEETDSKDESKPKKKLGRKSRKSIADLN